MMTGNRSGNTRIQANLKRSGRRHSMLLIIGLLFVVSGCGIKWWYNQVDYLLRFRVDHYFDITAQQKDFITRQLEKHLVWHRYEGIPVHMAFLTATQHNLADHVTRDEIYWFLNQYREQMRLIVSRLSADSVDFLQLLSPGQIDYFSKQLREENEKYEKRLKLPKSERLAQRADKTIKFLDDWLGSLTDSQEAEIRRLSLALPDNFEVWYRQRTERQQHFIRTLRESSSKDDIQAALNQLLLPPETDSRDSSFNQLADMVLTIDGMVSSGQRQHVIGKLQDWIDSLNAISRTASG